MRKLRRNISSEAESKQSHVCVFCSLASRIMSPSAAFAVVAFTALCTFAITIAIGALAVAAPLARCEIQKINPENTPATMSERTRPACRTTANNNIARYYQRGPDGDWVVPLHVDCNDPRVLLLLMAPDNPLLLELSIFVDGIPFCYRRDKLIDDAMRLAEQSTKENRDSHLAIRKDTAANSSTSSGAGSHWDEKVGESQNYDVSSYGYRRAVPQQRLMQYAALVGGELGRYEARWLLAQWTPGPTLMILKQGFATERAGAAPLWDVLDQDADDRISAEEAADAHKVLRCCDKDENDLLQLNELAQATSVHSRDRAAWRPSFLLFIINDSIDWLGLQEELHKIYGKIPDHLAATLEEGKLSGLSPDITACIHLGKNDKAVAGMSVENVSKRISSVFLPPDPSSQIIAMDLGNVRLELSAAQEQLTDSAASESDQVAVGAVVDGYPLFRLLDANADRQLSLREMKAVRHCLAQLDRNHNGVLCKKEVSTPIRLIVTKGPHAHRLLRVPRSVMSEGIIKTCQEPPAWFIGMDKNNDGDLARDEFLGTEEQFQQLDANTDGWVSSEEALKSLK